VCRRFLGTHCLHQWSMYIEWPNFCLFTAFPVPSPYWPGKDINPHYSPWHFRNTNLYKPTNSHCTFWPWRWRQNVPPKRQRHIPEISILPSYRTENMKSNIVTLDSHLPAGIQMISLEVSLQKFLVYTIFHPCCLFLQLKDWVLMRILVSGSSKTDLCMYFSGSSVLRTGNVGWWNIVLLEMSVPFFQLLNNFGTWCRILSWHWAQFAVVNLFRESQINTGPRHSVSLLWSTNSVELFLFWR
jgi:hypothetical protein